MTTAAGPARVDRTRPWHGPASLAGVVVGVLLWSLPYTGVVGRTVWVWALPPLLGLVLLPFRGPLRQAGVGLLASCLVVPVGVLVFGVMGFTVA